MALLPTGSDKIIEIRTSLLNIVIKSKNSQLKITDTSVESSSLCVTACDLERIIIDNNKDLTFDSIEGISCHCIKTAPLFFEQTDYEIVINSVHGETLSLWNENYLIREKVGPVIEGNYDLLSGIINFGNTVGFSDFEIRANGKKVILLRIEVFPSKISYKEDYQKMITDISEMIYAASIDFMQKTYQEFSIDDKQNNVPAIFFQIISKIFEKYIDAVSRIIRVPHHKLVAEHMVVPEFKAKKIDRQSEKWLMHHQGNVKVNSSVIIADRVLAVKKQITYDTTENRFVKHILKLTIQKLEDFLVRYKKSVQHIDNSIIENAESMIRRIRSILSNSFLTEVSEYRLTQSMSLVFGMAPGYKELYKYYLMLHRGLSLHGDVFRISVKDTAQLYEYWCFIKLFNILKQNYKLITPDIIKIDNTGITVSLVKGKKSTAVFINPQNGEHISLVYNPGETKTQTVNQRPDNVLELEKKGTEVSYKYVFDAKYRIETDPANKFYPDNNPGPKVDDINTMHRYRDSIVYENKLSRFTFEKTMFGAYILFPYDNEELYKDHRFYKSIDSVNIGGLPFLPGATQLVQKLLDELILDSKESAFERATLPRGIEEKLAVVDWNRRDILIGTFRSKDQFQICYDEKFYYIPKKLIREKNLPIHHVALYQTKKKFGKQAGIYYYGEVLSMVPVKRKNITEVALIRNNEEEEYYRFNVREWKKLAKPIIPKEKGMICEYTNMFLLTHSEYIQELLIRNEEQYRFYTELKRIVNSTEINENNGLIGFEFNDTKYIFDRGKILAIRNDAIVESLLIADFAKKPATSFRKLQASVGDLLE